MGQYMKVKNWASFQHYKDRRPPWIRLHRALLDNYEYSLLPVASRALLPMIWLLISDQSDPADGKIEYSIEKIAFRLRQTPTEIDKALKPLLDKGFLILYQDASNMLASCYQHATSETEAETETETETETDYCPETGIPEQKPTPTQTDVTARQQQAVMEFECDGLKSTYTLTESEVARYAAAYPKLDIEAEARMAKAWLESNPDRRKTYTGMPRFLNNWFSKSTNSARAAPGGRGGARPEQIATPARGGLFDEPEP